MSNTVTYRIKTIHSLKGVYFVNKAVEREFTIKWKPISKMMEHYPEFVLPAQFDEACVQSSFAAATEYLKSWDWYVLRRPKVT